MRSFLIFSAILISVNCYSQQSNAKYWNRDSLLTWADFKGPVDTTIKLAAMTRTRSFYDFHFENINGIKVAMCNARCFFIRNKSWSIPDKQSPRLLAHEQLHFNITQYFTVQFSRIVNMRNFGDTINTNAEIQKIYLQVGLKQSELQLLYDQQTNHGNNITMQKQWTDVVEVLLNKNISLAEMVKIIPK
jgi:hypothetical protein